MSAIVKFKSDIQRSSIERIECIREDYRFVYIADKGARRNEIERRRSKFSRNENYHDTWEEAREFLAANAGKELSNAIRELNREHERLWEINHMQPPKESP